MDLFFSQVGNALLTVPAIAAAARTPTSCLLSRTSATSITINIDGQRLDADGFLPGALDVLMECPVTIVEVTPETKRVRRSFRLDRGATIPIAAPWQPVLDDGLYLHTGLVGSALGVPVAMAAMSVPAALSRSSAFPLGSFTPHWLKARPVVSALVQMELGTRLRRAIDRLGAIPRLGTPLVLASQRLILEPVFTQDEAGAAGFDPARWALALPAVGDPDLDVYWLAAALYHAHAFSRGEGAVYALCRLLLSQNGAPPAVDIAHQIVAEAAQAAEMALTMAASLPARPSGLQAQVPPGIQDLVSLSQAERRRHILERLLPIATTTANGLSALVSDCREAWHAPERHLTIPTRPVPSKRLSPVSDLKLEPNRRIQGGVLLTYRAAAHPHPLRVSVDQIANDGEHFLLTIRGDGHQPLITLGPVPSTLLHILNGQSQIDIVREDNVDVHRINSLPLMIDGLTEARTASSE